MSNNLIIAVVSVSGTLVGGVLVALINHFSNKDTTGLAALKIIIDKVSEENKSLKEEFNALRDELHLTEGKLRDLQDTVNLLESSHNDSPLPSWIKDTKGTMVFLNPAYEEIFLIPRGKTKKEYIGDRDHAVWPREIAFAFEANDRKVLNSGRVWHGKETVIYNGKEQEWGIIKYPRFSGRIKVGIAGIAIPPDGVKIE